jgi:hypothetical protein
VKAQFLLKLSSTTDVTIVSMVLLTLDQNSH